MTAYPELADIINRVQRSSHELGDHVALVCSALQTHYRELSRSGAINESSYDKPKKDIKPKESNKKTEDK